MLVFMTKPATDYPIERNTTVLMVHTITISDDNTAIKLAVPVCITGIICSFGVNGDISVFEKKKLIRT